jgi:mRNA-degrading endonuclease YafQ of YafQ-DinJ toxin-antitoxin module
MNYNIRRTSQFKKDYKRLIKRGLDINKLDKVIELLATNGFLSLEYTVTVKYPRTYPPECVKSRLR